MANMNSFSNNRTMAALSYGNILFLVPLLTSARRDPFVKFHARQGMALFVIETVVGWVPVFGWAIMLACVVASVVGFVSALQGREWEVPFLGKYAAQIEL